MGWRGKTTDDLVVLALLQGEEPTMGGELANRIDEGEWDRAYLAEGHGSPISLTGLNVHTRLRRLCKKDRLAEVREDGTYRQLIGYRVLKPGEAEEMREQAWERATPSDEDRALAADLAERAEVEVELGVLRAAIGSHIGYIKVTSNKGYSEHRFFPEHSSWEEELRGLLEPGAEAA